MESSVLRTYNALECAVSRLQSCAIEVTVAQDGVIADRQTVIKIALPSAIQPDAWNTRSSSRTMIGTTIRRSATGRQLRGVQKTFFNGTSAIAIPASSIPIGPIIAPTLLSVLTIGEDSEICRRYKSAPATIAIRLTLVRIFFHSSFAPSCRQALACVQRRIS